MSSSTFRCGELSKNTLSMKFMQKSRERVEAEREELRFSHAGSGTLDTAAAAGGGASETQQQRQRRLYRLERSQAACEDWLTFMRMSYSGQNADVERLMVRQAEERDERESEAREKEAGVSDEEMADRYSSLVGTIARKYKKMKRPRPMGDDTTSSHTAAGAGPEPPRHRKYSRTFRKPTD